MIWMIIFKWIIWLFILFLAGCASIGPRTINIDRGRYNEVIRDTNHKQLLSNIVRLRYVEPTYFMKLANVTASYSLESALNNNSQRLFAFTKTSGGGVPSSSMTTTEINPNLFYADRPTISYAPVEDAQFANELLTPVSLQNLQLLFAGGIDEPNTLMRLVVQSVNDIDNASSASSAKLSKLPQYKKYFQFLSLLLDLYQQEGCELLPMKIDGKFSLAIHFSEHCINSPTAKAIRRMLNISKKTQNIVLAEYGEIPPSPNTAFIRTRSVYGMMTFLSYGVQIPPSDIAAHYVYQYHYPNGEPFDWTPLMDGLITIYSSDVEPRDTFVKVVVHNHWFYILESDLNSKATFTLLLRLITLTAGKQLGSAGPAPVVTIPANS